MRRSIGSSMIILWLSLHWASPTFTSRGWGPCMVIHGDFMVILWWFNGDLMVINGNIIGQNYLVVVDGRYMAMSQNCVWNVPRCSGRMERRGFVTGLVPDLWNVMKYTLYINISIYVYCIYYMCNICIYNYISRICTLKLLPLAAAHFYFSSARHPCCTPVQRRFALHG